MDEHRLDPVLEALFARERMAHPPDPAGAAVVLRKVERAALLGSPAAAPPASIPVPSRIAGATARTVALASVLSFAVGAGVGWGLRGAAGVSPTPVVLEGPIASAPAVPSAPLAPSTPATSSSPWSPVPPVLPASEPGEMRAPPVSAAPTSRTKAAPAASDLAKEGEYIETARVALARGRAADALQAIEEHAARFPHGRLVEEREALAVQALVLAGEAGAAQARAARFHHAYPDSVFGPAVDRALAPSPPR
jgi:hypothetical protein